jgi:multiple sugar transport system substrate-binding protein
MRSTTRRSASVLATFVVITATVFAACSGTTPSSAPSTAPSAGTSAAPSAAEHEPVTIVVGALRPGVTQEAVDALYEQIGQFEAQYPWITVEPEEYNWTAPTFTAALAAGTLPDVFTIPFTDGKGLIANGQIVDIDSLIREYGYVDKFNPNVLVNGQDESGKVFAVPTAAYGMSLTYNRSLFSAAGLDPDSPPTTWDEVRAAAKTIAEQTGVAGYAQMATENTGGWQLTTSTYALGGRMQETAADGKVTSTVNNPQTKAVLERLKAMRWEDQSMGATFDYAWGTMNQAFASGQVGMFTGGSDLYTWMIQNAALKPDDYGITTIPLEGSDAGVLGGGTLAAVNVVTTAAEREAAVAWIDFYYIQKLITQEGAVADAEALAANDQPVGVPALPVFDKATYDESQVWIKDFINVPVAQMTPFTSKIFDQPLINEPVAHTQELYAALDPVVQAVLTDQNADIDALLTAADAQIQAILDAG